MRIAIIKNMIAPYTAPLFDELAARADIDLLVVYETSTESNRDWVLPPLAYRHQVLRSWSVDLRRVGTEGYLHLPANGLGRLWSFRPDVVIASGAGVWSSPTNLLAMQRARKDGFAFVPWWGSFGHGRRTLSGTPIHLWKRAFVSRGDAWLAYGSRAAAHLASLGADPERTVVTPNVARPSETHGIAPAEDRPTAATRFFFAGQLIERKGIRLLLAAFSEVAGHELWIAGDGPLRQLVEDAARRDSRMQFLGQLGWAELHACYAQADALVLPSSYEVWGLVVNEALAHGIPVITTDQVAAADDLLDEGITGHVVPAADCAALAKAMRRVASWDAAQRRRCAVRGRERMAEWSIASAADGIIHAAELATAYRNR